MKVCGGVAMGYADASSVVDAPVEAVWNALNDIDHTPDWVVGLEKATIETSGPYGAGTIYHDFNRLGPVLQVTPWHITEFEPMSHQVHVSASAVLPSKMTLNLSPANQGTALTFVVEYQLLPKWRAVGRLLERLLMNRMIKSVLKQNIARLNVYLNSGSTRP
jgi:uncharacterized protein YndB with AHSA1/START domain